MPVFVLQAKLKLVWMDNDGTRAAFSNGKSNPGDGVTKQQREGGGEVIHTFFF